MTERPHYHIILFGMNFPDKYPWRKTVSGTQLYRSNYLEKTWTHGNAEISEMSYEAALYVAGYCLKKITGDMAHEHYKRYDLETGEILWLPPEYCEMSTNPGIGYTWLKKYGDTDVYPHDRVIINGSPQKPPRYYDEKLKQRSEIVHSIIKTRREKAARKNAQLPNQPTLASKETVTKARQALRKRRLEKLK